MHRQTYRCVLMPINRGMLRPPLDLPFNAVVCGWHAASDVQAAGCGLHHSFSLGPPSFVGIRGSEPPRALGAFQAEQRQLRSPQLHPPRGKRTAMWASPCLSSWMSLDGT